MFNRDGIRSASFSAPIQILANVEFQYSVGCIVPQSLVSAADADGKKIAKAGTPVKIDLSNTGTAVQGATASVVMNAVLLHDVDVTAGNANGTALIFGFINRNRIDSATNALITTALTASGVSPLLTFVNL